MKKHNFGAGPSILFPEVIQKASESVLDYNEIGLSILEISHRSKEFQAIIDEAQAIVKRLLKLENKYEVLFLQGGASLQFTMVAMNLLGKHNKAGYLDTGVWASGAIKEAKKIGEVHELASSKDKMYSYIPKGFEIPSDIDYIHYTSNNTIYGTQMREFPRKEGILMVCDMSSDILSKELDFNQFDLIYAGCQKNIGPSGATLVIVNREILQEDKKGKLPSYLDYQAQIAKGGMLNTPTTYSIYVALLSLQHLEKMGGISAIEKINIQKASLLYEELDNNPLFKTSVEKEDRSLMNVTFHLTDEKHAEAFNALCTESGIVGFKGHRSVGGYRVSIYNALPLESIYALISVMKELQNKI